MEVTRRGFLKLLGSLVVTSAADQVFGKQSLSGFDSPKKNSDICNYDLLWKSYFPTLKQNEGERFNFYRCSTKKLTVGYGCNIEDNSNLLNNKTIFYKGKPITENGKKFFLTHQKEKTEKNLADYSVSKADAVAMAKQFTYQAIRNLIDIFKDTKTNESTFFNLPIPMQVLALDIYFNLGPNKFSKYKKFKKALLDKNYKKASKEGIVYTGKKKTNKERERRKKRLFSITKLIQQNPKLSIQKIQELAAESYKSETPKLTRILAGSKDRVCENAIICGEFERNQIHTQLAQTKSSPSHHA